MVRKKYDGERMYFSKIMKSWEAVVRRVLSPTGCRVSPSASPSLLSLSCCPRGGCGLGSDGGTRPLAICQLWGIGWANNSAGSHLPYLSGRRGITTMHWVAEVRLWGAEVLPASGAGVLGFLALLLTSCQSGQNRWLQIVSKFSWCVA